jgi:NAD(P)-dependent dehydrogenase (short-subunit alcohol dehydrogenase family)
MREPRNKVCVMTGVTSGIGLEAAKQLAAGGMRVIGVGRTAEGCRRAEEEIRGSSHGVEVRVIAADLSSLGSVRGAAAAVREDLPDGRLDRLIHNAATVSDWYIGTVDGYELQFAVNYLAAFLLTHELFPALVRPEEARVITVSSGLHRRAEIRWEDPMFRGKYSGLKAYKQSKLALVLFTLELNRRVAHRFPVRAIGVEPGLVDAAIGEKNTGGLVAAHGTRKGTRGLDPADAAAAVVRLAADRAASIPADYWRLGRPSEPSSYARSVDAALRLWRLSERLCGIDFL